ncbi:MAG: FtsX-like permease family protein [Bacteroidota bacterium]
MNYELFIARKVSSTKLSAASVSRPIVRIAVAGVAIGFAVMIVAIAIVTGFKKEIREKVIGFGSHIQISNYDENNSYETRPVIKNDSFNAKLTAIKGVKHVEEFATKAGIIKTHDAIEGVVVKGVGKDFDWSYFNKRLVAGHSIVIPDSGKTNDVMISKLTATRLKLKLYDDLITYFIQQPPRARRFHICGIYETGLEEFDSKYIFCDISHIRQLNDWNENQTGGYEVSISDFSNLDKLGEKVYSAIPSDLNSRTIKELYPQIFDWLGLQDVNGIIIIVLMLIVSIMNMISALLIIILERVQMIGTLKALGAYNISVRKIFLYVSAFLIGRGLLIGNIIGMGLCLLQYFFHFIHLDQQSYYISFIPVSLSVEHILLLNGVTLSVCILMMILPTIIITKITPLQALRFS